MFYISVATKSNVYVLASGALMFEICNTFYWLIANLSMTMLNKSDSRKMFIAEDLGLIFAYKNVKRLLKMSIFCESSLDHLQNGIKKVPDEKGRNRLLKKILCINCGDKKNYRNCGGNS